MIGNVLLTMISVSITQLKCLLGFFFWGVVVFAIFPYVINKYLFREILCDYADILFFLKLSSGFCIYWYIFSATTITVVLLNGDFLKFPSFFYVIN